MGDEPALVGRVAREAAADMVVNAALANRAQRDEHSIAVTCVALYFISRKRKVEIDLEIEPVEDYDYNNAATPDDSALMAG